MTTLSNQSHTTTTAAPTFDQTVASMVDRVMADAESVSPYVVDHVIDTYDLTKEYDRRQARLYIQQQRMVLTDKAKAAKVASMSGQTTTKATPMIEVVVDSKGKTKEVINHGIAEVNVKPLQPTTKPMTTTTATPVAASPVLSVNHIESVYLRSAVEEHLNDYSTYGNLLSYPVFRETGAMTGTDPDLMLIRGREALTAYAYLFYTSGNASHTFTAILLDTSGKVKQVGAILDSAHYLPQYVQQGLFEKTTKSTPKATDKAVEPKSTKDNNPTPAPIELATRVQDTYNSPIMALKAAVNAYVVATGGSKLGSKATKTEVKNAAAAVLLKHKLPIPEPVAKADKAPATVGNIPTSDVMKAAAKATGVNVSNVNFRSSTQRAALAVTLGLM